VTVAKEQGVVRMRPRAGSASTYRSDGRRRVWPQGGRGAQATVLLVSILVVMVCAAASARAVTSPTTMDAASDVLARPAMSGALHGEMGAGGSPLAGAPALVAPASGAGGRASGATIFYDGFEGGMSNWSVLPASGVPTWATSTYRAAAGSSSAYCVGSQIPAPGPYANDMNAWMIAGPFDLSAVSSGTFQYKVYYNTEVDKDKVGAYVSIDNKTFYGHKNTGNSGGWIDRSIDLTNVYTLGNVCGKSQVWIAFAFVSDPAITYEGAYVDEVRVLASSSPTPTPTPTPGADDDIPGVAIPGSPFTGSVSRDTDRDDVFSIALTSGQALTASITGPSGSDFRLYLYAPGTSSVKDSDTPYEAVASGGSYPCSFSHTATQSGAYYLDVYSQSGAGDYTVTYSVSWPPPTELHWRLTPLQGPSRVHADARVRFTGWLRSTLTTGGSVGIARAGAYVKFRLAIPWEHFLDGRWQIPSRAWKRVFPVDPTSGLNYSAGARFKPGRWRVQATAKELGTGRLVKSPYKEFTVYP